jgi:two-component system response regulator FlrC
MALAATALEMPETAKILVVEDDLDLREAVEDTLMLAGFTPVLACSGEEALQQLIRYQDIQCVVSDVNMGGMDGHELLRIIKTKYPHIPVVLNTAYGSIDRSVDAMRDGAVDYLVKPFEPDVLVDTVSRYIGPYNTTGDGEPVANDCASLQLLQLARRVAKSDATALIIGESGTGKEVLAHYIHNHSPRSKQPFIAINCAAIPENMLEAMLFGHEKGAFTGAYTSAPGKFEQANGGTLLLDEISEMDLGLQAKLLRVLQEREVERLGGRKVIQLDVRVIATSNRDMRRHVAEGKFREDLYFRLSVLPLQWAPLRDRPADILPLAEGLLAKHSEKQHRHGMQLSPAAIDALMQHTWPGNVRELDNVIQRALILQSGTTVQPVDLGLQADVYISEKPNLLTIDSGARLVTSVPDELIADSTTLPSSAEILECDAEDTANLGGDLKQKEFEIIVSALKQERGSKKNTADRLGISPRTLRYKIARLKEMGMDINRLSYR